MFKISLDKFNNFVNYNLIELMILNKIIIDKDLSIILTNYYNLVLSHNNWLNNKDKSLDLFYSEIFWYNYKNYEDSLSIVLDDDQKYLVEIFNKINQY
jgi:hypothetical protein